jgi:hypothetical protein
MRDGKPIQGASVVIRVMPTASVLHAAKAGVPIVTPVVVETTTNASGSFAATPQGVRATDLVDGSANFLAFFSDGTASLPWSFSLPMKISGATAQVDLAAANPTATSTADLAQGQRRGVNLHLDLGKASGGQDLNDSPTNWKGVPSTQLTSAGLLKAPTSPVDATTNPSLGVDAAAVGGVVKPMGCGVVIPLNLYRYGIQEAFANVWSWTGALVTFHESTSSNHQLGIAFKTSAGGWSQNGTQTFTESGGGSADVSGLWDNQVNNKVNYRAITWYCANGAQGWMPDSTYALAYPILGWPHSSHPKWSSCVTYGSGAVMTKTQGKNTTYGYGVSFGEVSLSTQSGWDQSVDIKFNFTATSKLCGSTGAGWVGSPEAEAHQ